VFGITALLRVLSYSASFWPRCAGIEAELSFFLVFLWVKTVVVFQQSDHGRQGQKIGFSFHPKS